jgi:tRNA (guanine37-N1)-methyltransferase
VQLDVFTLVPHAFAWLTEQRPVATVLGTELDLRLFSYRDTTPLRAAQVDDEPYGGGAGMVLRVDVVAAALDAALRRRPNIASIALSPQGRTADAGRPSRSSPARETLTLLSARLRGFDERVVQHLASDAISIGPYVLSNGDLPAMVLVDAIARRLPVPIKEESARSRASPPSSKAGFEYPALHAVAGASAAGACRRSAFRRSRQDRRMAALTEPAADGHVSTRTRCSAARVGVAARDRGRYRRAALERGYQDGLVGRAPRRVRRPARSESGRATTTAYPRSTTEATHAHPIDHLFPNLPHGWRVAIDWVVHDRRRGRDRARDQGVGGQPYRIPSSSMEPTLHCAAAGARVRGPDVRPRARVPVLYHFRSPHRDDIVVFNTPPLAKQECGSRGTFVKRLIGPPGDVWEEREGFVYINGQKLNEPYIKPGPARRPDDGAVRLTPAEHLHPDPEGHVPDDGGQPEVLVRLPGLGASSRART